MIGGVLAAALIAAPAPVEAPEGFVVDVYAEAEGARSLARAPNGVLFVGTRGERVYAVRDVDGDGRGERTTVVAKGLRRPNGVAVRGGDLYVAEIHRVLVYRGAVQKAGRGEPIGDPEVVSRFPTDEHHGWKYLAFGPDGRLYVQVGAPCNVCDPDDEVYAALHRMKPDGSGREVFAHGIRNTVGFDWHPRTKVLYFTDNGRDWLGDTEPPCEINRAPKAGLHFGFPYCHGGEILDPEFGEGKDCADYVRPVHRLKAHAAPLGIRFYTAGQFPKRFRGQALVAEHGSWNRSRKVGYRVMLATLDAAGDVVAYEPFLTGFLDHATQKVSGRPVDMVLTPAGGLLLSDDYAGVVYRVRYSGAGETAREDGCVTPGCEPEGDVSGSGR